ncbi:unnamed protein product [Adineta ricciae]|uniref:Transmembrane protein n=1 Tax=Adineta ricciae TaxID=249248 RepID=A0A816AHU7_ADIRI|nr:unnamed protein product [Adineta ricciae]CAF1598327.1 unnamed protein product [Adineta ricciae]
MTDNQTKIIERNSSKLNSSNNINDLFDLNLLPFFCVLAHLIWTIVLIVLLDQCCVMTTKSLCQILLKLIISTCPLLLCSELSLIFICYINQLKIDLLIIVIKWLIFLSTFFISFWTGTLSDQKKWRGIHGGQIAPELHSPLYLFTN